MAELARSAGECGSSSYRLSGSSSGGDCGMNEWRKAVAAAAALQAAYAGMKDAHIEFRPTKDARLRLAAAALPTWCLGVLVVKGPEEVLG